MEQTDDDLVASARTGNGPAFSALVRRHARTLYRLALRLTGNAADAEEVLQDTFLQVHRKLGSFRGEAKFSTWLYRIALNAARMHLRARRSRIALRPIEEYLPRFDETGTHERPDVDESRAARADEVLERQELTQAALAWVAELPDLYRTAFVLRDLEGLDTAETAAILGVPIPAVRQRLHRARLIMRARLAELVGATS